MKLDLITKEDLEQFKLDIFAEMRSTLKKLGAPNENNEWLRTVDVRKLLRISAGTLQTLRINGTIRYSVVGKMFFYKREDINNMIEQNRSGQ
ncbi:MAG: DNA-binding protein [Chryseobacterium sp.]|nr:MAG: DNA-binding protein [Chryseobacterium sp.]